MDLAAVATAAPGFALTLALGWLYGRREVAAARREANTDPLTGLANRSGLMQQLHNRARRGHPYSLFLFDLNGFKAVNDTHGHRAGDELLRRLGERLHAHLGDHLVARLGGDEFVVVVDDQPTLGADRIIAAAILTVVNLPISLPGVPERVTVGAAIGSVRATAGADPRAVVHAADLAMYEAKTLGVRHRAGAAVPGPLSDSPRHRARDRHGVRVA